MKKIKGVQEIVHKILKEQPATRCDDFLLVLEVYKTKVPIIDNLTVSDAFRHHKDLNLPSFASIIRTRRKLQAQHAELCNDNVIEFREVQRGKFKQYALNIEE